MAAGLSLAFPKGLAELTLRIWKWDAMAATPLHLPQGCALGLTILRAGVPAGSYQMGDLMAPHIWCRF